MEKCIVCENEFHPCLLVGGFCGECLIFGQVEPPSEFEKVFQERWRDLV